MCNCRKKPEPPAVIPPIESVYDFDNIDEFFVPQTPDEQLHKELMDWKNLDKFEDEEEYPLIHD
jgi:hypothetical protein